MRKLVMLILPLLATAACQRQLPPAGGEESESRGASQVDASVVRPKIFRLAPLSMPEASTEQFSQAKLCSLDGLGEKTFASGRIDLSAKMPVLLHGWAGIDEIAIRAPSTVLIRFESIEVDGSVWGAEVPVGGRREDVANAQRAPSLMNSGLDSVLDLSNLPKGRYKVLLTYGENNKYICDGGWVVGLEK